MMLVDLFWKVKKTWVDSVAQESRVSAPRSGGEGNKVQSWRCEKRIAEKGEGARLTNEVNVVALEEETVPLNHTVVTSLHAKQAIDVVGGSLAKVDDTPIAALGEGFLDGWDVILLGVCHVNGSVR